MGLKMNTRNARSSDKAAFEDSGDSSVLESEAAQLTSAQRQELDRRIEDYKKDPSGNIPWETIKSDALARR